MGIFEFEIDKFTEYIKIKFKSSISSFNSYIHKLLFPLYAFPLKLVTNSAYYLVKFTLHLTITLIKILFETIIYPFRGLRNFLKSPDLTYSPFF